MQLFSAALSAFSSLALESLIPGVALGLALVVAVSLALRVMGPFNAATRGMIWTATLAALPLIPALYLVSHLTQPDSSKNPQAIQTAATSSPVRQVARPIAESPNPVPAYSPAHTSPRPAFEIPVPRDLPVTALAVYSAIVLLLLMRLLFSYWRICRLRRNTSPAPADLELRLQHWLARCPTDRPVQLRLCDRSRSPLAIGFFRPMIVMPAALVLALDQEEFDNLGVHELAHIRRYDDWSNLFQQLVQALLFFHPAVHWTARQLNLEREVACDDWVISTNGPHSYARCLAKVVELRMWQRGALLSSGAFFGKVQILKRVERILDRTRNAATSISLWTVAVVVMVLAGIAIEVAKLPGVVSITRNNGYGTKGRWRDDTRDLRVEMRGDITFSPDETSVASLSPWGYFQIEDSGSWTHRRLEVRPTPGGAPEARYFVDGRKQPLDDSGRAWAAATIPFLIREMGVDIEGRVQRILASRGVPGVLAEIKLIGNDHILRNYLNQLTDHAELTTDDLREVARSARRIHSDHEKAEFLVANARRYLSNDTEDTGLRTGYFQAVDSLSSDYDHRRVLLAALDADGRTPDTASRVSQSARLIHSDHDKAEVLIATTANPADIRCDSLSTARTLNSDYDKSRVLRDVAYQDSSACRTQYFDVVSQIHSDNDRANVLRTLLSRPGLSEPAYESIAHAARQMASNNEKANVLALLSESYTAAPFFEAVKSIQSDNDRTRVLKKVLEHSSSTATLLGVVDAASQMSSDNSRADILVAIATASTDPDVRAALETACTRLNSDHDYRRVATALFRDQSAPSAPRKH